MNARSKSSSLFMEMDLRISRGLGERVEPLTRSDLVPFARRPEAFFGINGVVMSDSSGAAAAAVLEVINGRGIGGRGLSRAPDALAGRTEPSRDDEIDAIL